MDRPGQVAAAGESAENFGLRKERAVDHRRDRDLLLLSDRTQQLQADDGVGGDTRTRGGALAWAKGGAVGSVVVGKSGSFVEIELGKIALVAFVEAGEIEVEGSGRVVAVGRAAVVDCSKIACGRLAQVGSKGGSVDGSLSKILHFDATAEEEDAADSRKKSLAKKAIGCAEERWKDRLEWAGN
jgi:hypothetical protein